MNWRVDWVLLATGLIGLGLTMVQQGRVDVLRLLSDGSQPADGLLVGASGLIVPVCLLGAFIVRFCRRVVTRTWK